MINGNILEIMGFQGEAWKYQADTVFTATDIIATTIYYFRLI